MRHVFIIYSYQDTPVMQKMVQYLERCGIPACTEETHRAGTPEWEREIDRALKASPAVVVLLSPDAATSERVRLELIAARMRQLPVYPVLVRGDAAAAAPCFPSLLNDLPVLDLSCDEKFEPGVMTLMERLREHLTDPAEVRYRKRFQILEQLARPMPGLDWMALTTVDERRLAFYTKHPGHKPADRLNVLSTAMVSIGERITSELGAGFLDFTVSRGKEGTIFLFMLTGELILIFKMENNSSLDAVFGHLDDARPLMQQLIDLAH